MRLLKEDGFLEHIGLTRFQAKMIVEANGAECDGHSGKPNTWTFCIVAGQEDSVALAVEALGMKIVDTARFPAGSDRDPEFIKDGFVQLCQISGFPDR